MSITIKESQHLSIPFEHIDVATEKFTKVIGKGGYGFVYEGELLLSGKLTTVAVKRLNPNISGQGFKEFLTEIKLLSRYQHPNLISLLGFCEQGNEKILIYEHAVHGSLDKYLRSDDKATPSLLTWTQRINICIDAARGLDYLHNHVGKFHRIIHRDIKSSNILLDQSWKAMISDLGLSKIGRSNENDSYLITNACGTHGYCDPAYRDTGILTKESDVYSFGVVLFEVLCGRLSFMNVQNEQRFLDRLAQRYYETGRLNEIIDIELKNQIGSTSLNIIADIAYQCLQNDREKRPSMGLVVQKLEEARESQRMIDKPQGTSGAASDELSSAETDVTQWNVLQFNTASTSPFIIKHGANSNSELVIKADGRVQEPKDEFLGIGAKPYTFSYGVLRDATGEFSPENKLGEGGFGPVYKGTLDDGRLIAVKQLSIASHQGKSQFVAEIETISAVQHHNLVKLYGCCIDGEKRLLVYEYLENKSLDQALFGNNSLSLNWSTRFEICLGVARGLAYLHEESRIRVVHRDVKASNVLLDSNMIPKISDFGLAKLYDDKQTQLSRRVVGTIGYLAPEYAMRGHFTEKVDVFGFGIVALELISGRPNSNSTLEDEKIYLLEWAWNLHELDRELELVDEKLLEYDENEVRRVMKVALLCIQTSPMKRPSMSRVVAMLSGDRKASGVITRPEYLARFEINDATTFGSSLPISVTDLAASTSRSTASPTSRYNVFKKTLRGLFGRRRDRIQDELLGIDAKPYTFSYRELRDATGDFSPKNKLGEGGFGPVYKGTLNDGRLIAVKKLSTASRQGKSEFVAEIATISAVQHRNLVKLYGCCIDGGKGLLVYEYLVNKSLDQALFGNNSLSLSWSTRFEICLGVARGLAYMHEESRIRVIHRDVKASNVLLDSDWIPKISDFGLAKLYDDEQTHMSTRVAGTIGYLAPEYAIRGHLTEKVDVFGFGVVALEIISGRPNSDSTLEDEKIYLLEWAWNLHEADTELELVDKKLSEYDENEVRRVMRVGLLCTQASPIQRPSMSQVVAMLSGYIEATGVITRPDYLTGFESNDATTFGSSGLPISAADLTASASPIRDGR